jgi:hypothetical protein
LPAKKIGLLTGPLSFLLEGDGPNRNDWTSARAEDAVTRPPHP